MVGGGDAGTEYTHQDAGPANESRDNLLIAHTGAHGSRYQDTNETVLYGGFRLRSPSIGAPAYTDEGSEPGWRSEWDKKGASGGVGSGVLGPLLSMKVG